MQLSNSLQSKIDGLYKSLNKAELERSQKNLTERYKHLSGSGQSLIKSNLDSKLYAISRMPATYAVIATLLGQLKGQGLLLNVNSVVDIGSGTGSGYFAVKDLYGDVDVRLFEKDDNMIEVFKELTEFGVNVEKIDITKQNISLDKPPDLVICSYVLSEMEEQDRQAVLGKILSLNSKYVLLIDTGTPKIYEEYMKLKAIALASGAKVLAPCMTAECSLRDDYCQFYARVERSSLHRLAKDARLPYEDEKYFYLLLARSEEEVSDAGSRVIRRPEIMKNITRLKLCTANGVVKRTFTKSNKAEYMRAKKVKINGIF